MRWIVIILLVLCSCRSSKETENYRMNERFTSELRADYERRYTDYLYSIITAKFGSKIAITEDIKEMSYDSIGNVMNTVNTNRNINIDVNGDIANNGLNVQVEEIRDSTNHFAGVSKMIESESVEMLEGGQDDFGKWIAIFIGLCMIVFVAILTKKLE